MGTRKAQSEQQADVQAFCQMMGWPVQSFLGALAAIVADLWPPEREEDWISHKLVRRGDPETSIKAAAVVAPKITLLRGMAFAVMMREAYPQLHQLCADAFYACGIHIDANCSTARSRINDLVREVGVVERYGGRVPNRAGNLADRFRVKPVIRWRAARIMNRYGLHVPDTDGPDRPPDQYPTFPRVPRPDRGDGPTAAPSVSSDPPAAPVSSAAAAHTAGAPGGADDPARSSGMTAPDGPAVSGANPAMPVSTPLPFGPLPAGALPSGGRAARGYPSPDPERLPTWWSRDWMQTVTPDEP